MDLGLAFAVVALIEAVAIVSLIAIINSIYNQLKDEKSKSKGSHIHIIGKRKPKPRKDHVDEKKPE